MLTAVLNVDKKTAELALESYLSNFTSRVELHDTAPLALRIHSKAFRQLQERETRQRIGYGKLESSFAQTFRNLKMSG